MMKDSRFTMSQNCFSLLAGAKENETNSEYAFCIRGDLNQMLTQESFLESHEFSVRRSNVYLVIKETDVPTTLKLIFEHCI